MRVVRDRAEARWLPSRFHFALGRLTAYLVYRRTAPREQCGLALAIDRNQNSIESYVASIGVLVVTACYTSVVLARFVHPVAAGLLAAPTVLIILQFVIPLLPLAAGRYAADVNSMFLTIAIVALSLYFGVSGGWVQVVARAFLAVMLLNALAAVAVWPLRRRFLELEARYEGVPP